MKKLIFIDNDGEKRATEDVDSAKSVLEHYGGIPSEQLDTMEIVPNFGSLPKDEIYKLLFSKDNCICSFSMYTYNHMGSLTQLTKLLTAAGRNHIEGMVYVDCSRMIEKTLERVIPTFEHAFDLLNAIETNNIISFDLDADLCFRLRVEFKGGHKSPFRREKINLLELLK